MTFLTGRYAELQCHFVIEVSDIMSYKLYKYVGFF